MEEDIIDIFLSIQTICIYELDRICSIVSYSYTDSIQFSHHVFCWCDKVVMGKFYIHRVRDNISIERLTTILPILTSKNRYVPKLQSPIPSHTNLKPCG